MRTLRRQHIEEDEETIHPPITGIVDALSFQVAQLAARNERVGSHRFKTAHDITLTQWRVLGLTAAFGPVPSRKVRDILDMDKGQLSRVVKKLTDRGLIETAPLQSNSSAIELRLTPAGRDLHDVLIRFTAERNEACVSVLTPEECQQFLHLLGKINAHTQALSTTLGSSDD